MIKSHRKITYLNLVLVTLLMSNWAPAQAWALADFKPDLAGIRHSVGAFLAQGARQADHWVTDFANKLLANRQQQIAAVAVGTALTAYATYRFIKACQPPVPPAVKLQQDSSAEIEQRCQQWLKEQRVQQVQHLWRRDLNRLQTRLNQQRLKPALEALLAQGLDLITYLDHTGQRITDPETVSCWSKKTVTLQQNVIALLRQHKIDLSKIKLVLTAQPLLARQSSVALYASRHTPGHYLLQLNLNRWWSIPKLTPPARGTRVIGTAGAAVASAVDAVSLELEAWEQRFDPETTKTTLGWRGWDSKAIFETQILRCIAQIKHQDDLQLDLVLLQLQEPMLAVLGVNPQTSTNKLTGMLRQVEQQAAAYAKLCTERADLFAMWHHSQGALVVQEQLEDFDFRHETAQYDFFQSAGYHFYDYRQAELWRELRRRLVAIRDGAIA